MAAGSMDPPGGVSHDSEAGRFELELEEGRAYLRYRLEGGVMDLVSTWVPPAHRHGGIGERVVLAALEHARTQGYRVIPTCPFVSHVLAANLRYADLVEKGSGGSEPG